MRCGGTSSFRVLDHDQSEISPWWLVRVGRYGGKGWLVVLFVFRVCVCFYFFPFEVC